MNAIRCSTEDEVVIAASGRAIRESRHDPGPDAALDNVYAEGFVHPQQTAWRWR